MSEVYTILVPEEAEGQRLDAFLSDQYAEMTRSHFQKLIQEGHVSVEGRENIAKNYRLKAGDVVMAVIPEPEILDIRPEPIPLSIVYEDQDLLVVDKPQGMVVHPAPGNPNGTLVNAILCHCGDQLSSINGVIRPGIVHRIDKDTSGLLVVAKSDDAHQGLAKQFQVHSIHRVYHAVVWNHFRQETGRIDRPIGRDPRNRLRMAVVPEGRGRHAVTHYRVIRQKNGFASIECTLETGRTHQIRVHMASIQHPLLGDPVYGPGKSKWKVAGQILHAKELGFIHPRTGEEMRFCSPLPEYFEKVLTQTGLDGQDAE